MKTCLREPFLPGGVKEETVLYPAILVRNGSAGRKRSQAVVSGARAARPSQDAQMVGPPTELFKDT
jgi:hypothetical protein